MPTYNFPLILPNGALPPRVGLRPIALGLRNGVAPPGAGVRKVGAFANEILAFRRRVLFKKSIPVSDAYTTSGSNATWRFRFRSAGIPVTIKARHIFAPANDTGALTPRVYWTTQVAGGGASTTQSSVFFDLRDTGTITADKLRDMGAQTWSSISANTDYECTLTQVDKCRLVSCEVWEEPQLFLSESTHTEMINLKGFAEGYQITDEDVSGFFTNLDALYAKNGPHYFSWSAPAQTGVSTTNTNYENPFDTSYTAYNSSAPGFWTAPKYHHRYSTDNGGSYASGKNQVKVICYAVLSGSPATAYVEFRDTNGQIAELSSGAASATFVASSVTTWDAGYSDDQKVDILIKKAGAGTAYVYAAGMYATES